MRTATHVARPTRAGRWIDHWDPEDPVFWAATGRAVARRNLLLSILAEHLGFSVWLLWSAVVVFLPAAGHPFSIDQLFWLVALPNLVGATLRLPYTFAVPRFGGRNWTVVSALLLLAPLLLLVLAVGRPGTPYWVLLLAAATAGLGGGNFASSMANISFFYPERHKGTALGLNAAGGNVGVSVVQLLVPVVVTLGGGLHLARAGLLWVLPVLVAALLAWRHMDNLSGARSALREQTVAARRGHTWVMSFLYVGTFGSFIGYSAALPLLVKTQFPEVPAARFAFLGALVGSLSRPLGGWLADRFGGARVTAVNFVAMAAGALAVLGALRLHSFPAFLLAFLLLFVTSGLGNGSTYRMIPAIFHARALAAGGDPASLLAGRREAAAALGIASAVGAYGGFLVPRGYGSALAQTGRVDAAFYAFVAFYAGCLAVTWWCYLRQRVLPRVPSLTVARI
ncbi:MAG: NarK family nitrate/nitrite MFS transporter [Actinomycetota bacterium]